MGMPRIMGGCVCVCVWERERESMHNEDLVHGHARPVPHVMGV